MQILDQKAIKLNSVWMPVGEITIQQAMSDMFALAVRGMCINSAGEYYPVGLEEWLKLPLRDGLDVGIRTSKIVVREPRVVIAVNYSKMPKRTPKNNTAGVRLRDGGRCQVTGEHCPADGSVDHLMPISRGGDKKSWKNQVWMKAELNHKKGARTLEEMGWSLLRQPFEPLPVPAYQFIRPSHSDHELFLKR